MVRTEEEARKSTCLVKGILGMLIIQTLKEAAEKEGKTIHTDDLCMGTQCMYWRWHGLEGGLIDRRGFCGLGGKP